MVNLPWSLRYLSQHPPRLRHLHELFFTPPASCRGLQLRSSSLTRKSWRSLKLYPSTFPLPCSPLFSQHLTDLGDLLPLPSYDCLPGFTDLRIHVTSLPLVLQSRPLTKILRFHKITIAPSTDTKLNQALPKEG